MTVRIKQHNWFTLQVCILFLKSDVADIFHQSQRDMTWRKSVSTGGFNVDDLTEILPPGAPSLQCTESEGQLNVCGCLLFGVWSCCNINWCVKVR